MDSAPGFDEDDLINDHFDDFPEPDYEDEFDDMPEQDEPSEAELGTTAVTVVATSPTRQPSSTTAEAGDEVPSSPMRHAEDDSSVSVREAFAQRPQQRPAENIFKFERYDENAVWRTRASNARGESPGRARAWKSRTQSAFADLNDPATNGTKPAIIVATKAPDAQLLEFQKKAWSSRPNKNNRKHTRKVQLPTRPQPGMENQSMTLADGTRVWLGIQDGKIGNNENHSNNNNNSNTHALGISVGDLLERVQAIRRRQEHQKLLNMNHNNSDGNTSNQGVTMSPSSNSTADHHQMWVDKHAPTKFAHLLSDERTNRNVLRALRSWDPYVFQKAPLPLPEFGKPLQEEVNSNAKDSRPHESKRVILLSGPPGVGKTTLAHIVARHAGYRVLEVNGSDDRSSNVLRERIANAMERTLPLNGNMNDASTNSRPNCIVLDEIDGADQAAIQTIVNLVRAELPGKTERRKQPYLKRPLILICNNRYAPSLRPLWPYCRHFLVTPPRPNRLVERLRSVLAPQGLIVSSSMLYQLASQAGGDIRSCLHMLQYAAAAVNPKSETIAVDEPFDLANDLAKAMGQGLKDSRSDLVGMLTCIFRKAKANMLVDKRIVRDKRNSTTTILDGMDSLSESTSKVMDALFENVLSVSYIDPTLDRCAAAHEWMSLASTQRGGTLAPTAAGALHLLCRVEQKPNLVYSTRVNADHQYTRDTNRQLVQRFKQGLSFKVKSYCPLETIPYGLWILSAGSGVGSLDRLATSVDILKPAERTSFDAHVDTLLNLGLTYTARQEEEQREYQAVATKPTLCFDPPIDTLIAFRGHENFDSSQVRREIPSAMKELLAHRATYKKLRDSSEDHHRDILPTTAPLPSESSARASAGTNKTNAANTAAAPMEVTPEPPTNKKRASSASSTTTTIGESDRDPKRPAAAAATPTVVTAQNFLGIQARKSKRLRSERTAARVGMVANTNVNSATKLKQRLSHTGSHVPLVQVVRLKYVKGFTQAVRAPCKLDDL